MFENLRDAFLEAVENFKHEVNREEDVPETVDRLFLAMQDELTQTRRLLEGLEKQIADASAEVARDKGEEDTCRRRAEMAKKVGDEETARIAVEYAVRYERRRMVLERKVVALGEEREIRVVEMSEMTERLTEARAKRDTLHAAADEGDVAETARAADDLFEELDRMAGEMDPPVGRSKRSAMDDLEAEFRELKVDPWAPIQRRTEADYDAALAELKRRMGKE